MEPQAPDIQQQAVMQALEDFSRRLSDLQEELGVYAIATIKSTELGIVPVIKYATREQMQKIISMHQQMQPEQK
jgi:hypothetical protein